MGRSLYKGTLRCCRRALLPACLVLLLGPWEVSVGELRILDIHQVGTSNVWRITWSSISGTNYVVQRADTLLPPVNWAPLLTLQATGTVAFADHVAAPDSSQSFYRVVQLSNTGPDTQAPTVTFADALMTTTNGAPALNLIFTATDNVAVASVILHEGTNILGAAAPAGGNNWALLVPADLNQLLGRFFFAVAQDPSGNQGVSAPVGLMAVDPDLLTPLDGNGQPSPNRPLFATATNQVGPFRYHPGGRPRPGAAPDLFLSFPDGATMQSANQTTTLQFVRASAGFETNSPFSLPAALVRGSGAPRQLTLGPLRFADLADLFNLDVTNGLPLVLFGQFPLNWVGGTLDDRGLVGAQFLPRIPNFPLPGWSQPLGNLLTEFAGDRTLHIPFSGQFTLPDGTTDAASLLVGQGAPLWLNLRPDGRISLDGPVELQWPNGSSVRAELSFDDPEYCLALRMSSLHVQALSNLVDLLPSNATGCVPATATPAQLAQATQCLDSFARAYGHFSAAVAASGSNAPVSAAAPPDYLNLAGEALEAWGYSAGPGIAQALPLDQIATLLTQVGHQASGNDELLSVMDYRQALLRARAAVQAGALTGSSGSAADLDAALAEAEAAALARASDPDAAQSLASITAVARMLVEAEALRQSANLPAGPLVTNALPGLFVRFAEHLADTYGVQTNVFVPDANPKINRLNRFVALETLHDTFDLLANAALTGTDLSATRLDQLVGQLGVQLFNTANAALNAAEATNDLPAFILAGQDLVELAGWVQQGVFPNVPALASLDDGSALDSLGNRLNALLAAELDRPLGTKSLGRQAAEIRTLLAVLRGVPGTVTFAAPPLRRAYDALETQLGLAVNPTALAADTNLLDLVNLVEAGTLHRELGARFGFPQSVNWETNRLPLVVQSLGSLAVALGGWRELDQSVQLLLNAAGRADLAGDEELRRNYLLQAGSLLDYSRTVARSLMQNASGLLRLLDLALPGDLIVDQPSGYACYDRQRATFHGALRGSLRLPKFGLALTVPDASFDTGGRFDVSLFGGLDFSGGHLSIPARQPLHLRQSPDHGLSLDGDARLNLANGLRLDASISLNDPMYCFGLSARSLELDLGQSLVVRIPTLSLDQVDTFGDSARDVLADYFKSLNGSLETLVAAATNFPPVDETGFGNPPEFSTPEITFDFSSLNAWSQDIIGKSQSGLSNIFQADIHPVLESLDRINQDARGGTNAIGVEQASLQKIADRMAMMERLQQAAQIAAQQQSIGNNDLSTLNSKLLDTARLLATNVLLEITPGLTNNLADSLDVSKLLFDAAALAQKIGAPEAQMLQDTGVGLAVAASRLQAGTLGLNPVSGSISNTNVFNALSEFELERNGRLLVTLEGDLRQLGVAETNDLLVLVTPVLFRQRSLDHQALTNTTDFDQKVEFTRRLFDILVTAQETGAETGDESSFAEQVLDYADAGLSSAQAADLARAIRASNDEATRRRRVLRTQVDHATGADRVNQLVAPGGYVPDYLTQLGLFFRVLGLPTPPDMVTNLNSYVRFKAQELRARPFTPELLTNELNQANALLTTVIGLTSWADQYLTNDFSTLTNLQFALTNLTYSVSAAAELQKDWWLVGRYQDVLSQHASIFGSNLNAALNDANRQAHDATLLASSRIAGSFSNLLSTLVTHADVLVPLPGQVELSRIFGNVCFDRTSGSLAGCFGGQVDFPQLGSNVFFDISQACLSSDGSYHIDASTAVPLPFGRAQLSSSLSVDGSPAGLAGFNGLGTLTLPNGTAGNRVFDVRVNYDPAAQQFAASATTTNLDLRLGDDFVLFNAGFGFILDTAAPDGALSVSGSAGLLARQHPLPASLARTNFQLVVDNLATVFTYSTNAFALSLTNGTLHLPEIFQAGLCSTNPGAPSGPQVGLVPGTPITVTVGTGTNPAVGFSGGLMFQNIGCAVPGLTNLTVEICSGQLLLQSNTLPYLTNLSATVTLPLPQQMALLDVTNGAWAVNGFPVGTLTLRSNLTLLDIAGFRFSLPGAQDAFCGDGTSLTVSNDAQGTFFTLDGGARFDIPSNVLGDDSGGAISLATCGSFSAGQNRSPQFSLDDLNLNGTFRLGGAGGLQISNAQVSLSGLENLFNATPATPWSLTLGGLINVPNGPQFGVSNLRFVFDGGTFPNIQPGSFSLASTNGLIPVPGLPFNVTAASLTFRNGAAGFLQLLAPTNLILTLSATMNIPPGTQPLISGQVDSLTLEMQNGLPTAHLDGIGVSFQGLEFPPVSIGGQVYIGGLDALGQGSVDDIFFAGKVGGTLNDIGIRGLFAFNMHGLIGYCFDVNAGPAGIPLDGGALGGFLLTGASGGVSFQSGNGDPCNFSTYYPVGADGKPLPNSQLPPDVVTNRPGAVRTWDAHRDQVAREHARAQLAYNAAATAAAVSLTNPPPPPPSGGTNPVVNVPTFPCPGGDCPPPTINILCQPHPDTNLFPNKVILKFSSLDEGQLNDLGITRSFVQGLGAATAQQIADTVSMMVRANVSQLIPRADPAVFTASFADQLNQQITNDLDQLQTTLDGLILSAVQGVLGNSDNVYDAIKTAAYAGVPCPDATIKLTGTFSHAAVSTVLSATAGVVLSSSGSAGVVGSLNLMGVPVGRIKQFISATDSHGNPNPSLCGEMVLAVGPIDVGSVDMMMGCDGCVSSLLSSFGSMVSCMGDAQALAVLARVKPSVTNLSVSQAIATLNNSEKVAFIGTVFSQPPVPGLYDCFLSSASNAVLNFSPYFQMCGEVKPKLFGFSLSPAAVSFNAGATRSNFAGSVTFSPSYIIQNALICAQSAGTVCYPLFPGFDEATLGFALGIPDPAPLFLGGLKGDLASPQALSGVVSNGFSSFLQNATMTVGYTIAPLGLSLASAQGRVVMPNLLAHPARPGYTYIPPEDRGIVNLPSRVDVLLRALSINYLLNPLWKGDANDLASIYPAGPQHDALAGLSFAVDYFPYGGLVGAGQLNLPKIIYDAPPAEVGTLLNGTNLLSQLSAASALITDYILTTTNVGSVGFYVPAPSPPSVVFNGTPLSQGAMMDAIKSFDGSPASFLNLYPAQLAFFRGFINGQVLGVPVASAQLDIVPAGPDSHFQLHAQIPANSWFKSFLDDAAIDFDLRGSPPQSVDVFFTNLLGQVQLALSTNDPATQQQALVAAQNSLDSALPKLALDLQANDFHVPAVLTNVLTGSASAELAAYSPRYDPSFVGTGLMADIKRNGGIALKGSFNFANYVTIPDAELGLTLRSADLPILSGSFDVASLGVPGLTLQNAHFGFVSDPPVGGSYIAANGSVNPISFINPLNGQPLLTIRNLTNSGAPISANFTLDRVFPNNDVPLPSFLISPSAIDMPMLGPGLSARIHGATTNDPFGFSSTGPWTNNVTIFGQLSIRDPLNPSFEIVRVGAVGQQFSATLSGNGMQMSQLTIVLPTNITVVSFPGTGSAQTNVLSSGGCANLLSISASGQLVLSAGMAADLDLTRYGFGVLSAGGCFALTNSQLTLSGTISGGALTNGGPGFSVSGTMIVTSNTVVLNGSATLNPLSIGVFVISGVNGGPLTASLLNGGLYLPSGARVRILASGFPSGDLFTLKDFAIAGSGDFGVTALNGALSLTNYFDLTQGTYTFARSNGVFTLSIAAPTLTLFPGQPNATSFSAFFTNVMVSSDASFYVDSGQKTFPLPAAFSASGRLELGYEPNPHQPGISVTPPASLNFGTINYGDSTNRFLTISNSGTAPLIASVSSSLPSVFTVSPASVTVEAGAAAQLSVRFTPTNGGSFSGTLAIAHNAGAPLNLSLAGTSRPVALLQLSASSLDLGSVPVKQTASQVLRFDNVGITNLLVTNVLTGTAFTVSPTNFTVAPGSNVLVAVSMTPSGISNVTGNLQVKANDPVGARNVPLSGAGAVLSWVDTRDGSEQVRALAFSGNSNGLAAASANTLLYTDDKAHSWSTPANTVTGVFHTVAIALNGTNGWVAGDNGAAYYTTNGGKAWLALAGLPSTNNWLCAVDQTGSGLVMLGGNDGGIHPTLAVQRSSGFDLVTLPNQSFDLSVPAVAWAKVGAQNIALAFSSLGKVWRSTDSGSNWVVAGSLGTNTIVSGAALSTNGIALAVGYNTIITVNSGSTLIGQLFRSADSGVTWTQIIYTNGFHFNSVTIEGNTAYAVGKDSDGSGVVLRSGDGGVTWLPEAVDAPGLFAVAERGGETFVGGDRGDIHRRPRNPPAGGLLTFGPGAINYGFVTFGDSVGRALTFQNVGIAPVTITNVAVLGSLAGQFAIGGTFPKTLAAGASDQVNLFYNPTLTTNFTATLQINDNDPEGIFNAQLTGSSASIGWVLKPSLTNSTGQNVVSVQMLSDTDGYAITPADVFKTSDGGASWRGLNVHPNGPLVGMFFFSTNVGWISGGNDLFGGGGNGYIRKTLNGGTSWTTQYTVTNQPVANIFMASSNIGYAVTYSYAQSFLSTVPGFVLKTLDSGGSWVVTNTPPASPFSGAALYAKSTTEVLATSGAVLYRSANGGSTWSAVVTNFSVFGNPASFADVTFVGTSSGWMVGGFGSVWRTSTGGTTASAWTGGFDEPDNLKCVSFASTSLGWIAPATTTASGDAHLYRTDDGGVSWRNELAESPYAGPGSMKPLAVFGRSTTSAVALGTDGCVRRLEVFSNLLQGITVVQPALDFGQAVLGVSRTTNFLVRNVGDAVLTVSNLLVDGVPGFNAGFRATTTVPFTVPVNGSVSVSVVASNLVAGTTRVPLTILSDGARQAVDIELRNTVVAPPPVVIFTTDPPGMPLLVDGTNVTAPVAYTLRDDTNGPNIWSSASDHTVEASPTNVLNGQAFAFSIWDPVEDRVFALNTSNSLAPVYVARYVRADDLTGGGSLPAMPLQLLSAEPGASRQSQDFTPPPAGMPNGPFLRLTQASLTNSVLGGFALNGSAFLCATNVDLTLASRSVRMPLNTAQPALFEMSAGSFRFQATPGVVQLNAQTPSLKVLSNSVAAPGSLTLNLNSVNTDFSAAFTLPQGLIVAPGLLALGPGTTVSLAHTTSFNIQATGQVLALKKPNANDWAFKSNLTLGFTDGPFTNSLTLTNFSLPLLVPGTPTAFLQIRGTNTLNSRFELRRNSSGVFTAVLTNLMLDVLGETLGPVSATASSGGLVSLALVQTSPFLVGPFDWVSTGTNALAWNIRDGTFAFTLANGTLKQHGSLVPGWPSGGLSFPGLAFDSQGDFQKTITLNGLTFDGIALGTTADPSDRYVTFKRQNGVLTLSLRDQQDFFGSSMKIGFDISNTGSAYGFFSGSFGIDFGLGIGYVDFGGVSLTYDSTPVQPGYQFTGTLNIGGNDFDVKFGSGGAQACYLICSPSGCSEVLCLP